MSRKVVPACGNLCFFCPSMRPRSRQPVKRYKKLLSDIFPRSQDAEPNDRKIMKLCEYASKNPLRMPKIVESLEVRFYKEMRIHHFGSVKVVLYIYRNLLTSCKDQMPLFASSLLGIVRILLDETQEDEMRILGCTTLVDFLNSQINSTNIFNLEGIIPKLYELAQEDGDDERALRLRSSSLQALASMVFMGEYSHSHSLDFDKIISVTLENYMDPSKPNFNIAKPEPNPTVDVSKNPYYWSRVCLQNMAQLAKEASTIRRVIEPLFHNFDVENNWLLEKGLAYSVLTYMQLLLEEAGLNSHLLLSMMVKHLDHKNVAKSSETQIDIVSLTSLLAKNAKHDASLAIIGAISDLVRHLRKCIQSSSAESEASSLQSAIEQCLAQLFKKVGDSGPVLDMMAVVLENLISSNAVVARATVYAVYRTALIFSRSSVPHLSYHKKSFPDGLFHQLLLAMAHSDHETRVWSHRILSIILLPKQSRTFHDNWKDIMIDGKVELPSLRLSGHQINLLLSAIWLQATSNENKFSNFEAMAQTFQLSLFFTQYKSSRHLVFGRCFQLALSLMNLSLDRKGSLRSSRRRSLFSMASFMIVSAAKAGNLQELVSIVKSSLGDEIVVKREGYGSEEDEIASANFLSEMKLDVKSLKELVASHLLAKFQTLPKGDLSSIRELVFHGFSLDDAYPLGVQLFMETPRPSSPLSQIEPQDSNEELMLTEALTDDEAFPELKTSQISINSLDILNVDQLLESVASFPVSSVPISYDQVKNQCEALVTGKQQKLLALQNIMLQEESKTIVLLEETDTKTVSENDLKLINVDQLLACSLDYAQKTSFSLPPASPYDKFLRATKC